MNNETFLQKSTTIYEIIKKLNIISKYYDDYDGTLTFRIKYCNNTMDCEINPNENNTYSFKIYKVHNMKQTTMLCIIRNIAPDKLYSTFIETVKFLVNEYDTNNLSSWYGYKSKLV